MKANWKGKKEEDSENELAPVHRVGQANDSL